MYAHKRRFPLLRRQMSMIKRVKTRRIFDLIYSQLDYCRFFLQPERRIFSHTTLRERLHLYKVAKSLPEFANVLEIGSHLGSSASIICSAIKRKSGHLTCIDTWMNDTMEGGAWDNFQTFEFNTRRYKRYISTIRRNSKTVVLADLETSYDLAFIDGDHSEEFVRSDCNLASQTIIHGGYLILHDASKIFPGVMKVLGELIATGEWSLVRLVNTMAILQKNNGSRK